jgi:hypothetical protein
MACVSIQASIKGHLYGSLVSNVFVSGYMCTTDGDGYFLCSSITSLLFHTPPPSRIVGTIVVVTLCIYSKY